VRKARTWIGLGIFLVAIGVGYLVAAPLAPERLRAELEVRLAETLHGQVHIGSVELSVGFGLTLEGLDLKVWPYDDGAGLHVDRVVASVRPLAHLTGQRRLRSLRLEGARMRVKRAPTGEWTPPPAAAIFSDRLREFEAEPGDRPHPHELLRPLIALEAATRFLLTMPLVADTVELVDSEIQLLDSRTLEDGVVARPLRLTNLRGRLQRRRLTGETRLEIHGRLADAAGDRGGFEWEGHHDRSGEVHMALAFTELQVEALAPHIRIVRPGSEIEASLSGVLSFDAPVPGHGEFKVDLVAKDVRSSYSEVEAADPSTEGASYHASHVELKGSIGITAQAVNIDSLRFTSDDLDLEIDGVVERPLHDASMATVRISIRDITVGEVRHLIGWLPDVEREEAQAIVGNIETGHLRMLRIAGTHSVAGWQAFLAGRSREIPAGFVIDADLEDATIRVGEADRLTELHGRLWWTGNRMEIRGATARLNDSPLPALDLSVEGISNLFASDPAAREIPAGAKPLTGLRAFWETFRKDPDDDSDAPAPQIQLDIERLHHPMFFWPITNLRALIDPLPGGVRIRTDGGSWGGVPISGSVDWLFEPSERVIAKFSAMPPRSAGRLKAPTDGRWAVGRFEVGAVTDGPWYQERATGRFEAEASKIQLRDVEIALRPAGHMVATAEFDLSMHDHVPYRTSFNLDGGDMVHLGELLGLDPGVMTGNVDVAGSFIGELRPGQSIPASLDGMMDLKIGAGTIRREIPAVFAIVLASDLFNPFAKHERVRFDRLETLLEFEAGQMTTDSFTLEGPDVRAFASGDVNVGSDPHNIDLEVVLFLFRPVDTVLEKIPLLNIVLLGPNENLLAAHFELEGPWKDPTARLVPLRSLASGPGSLVFETLPALLQRGIKALGAWFSLDETTEVPSLDPRLSSAAES